MSYFSPVIFKFYFSMKFIIFCPYLLPYFVADKLSCDVCLHFSYFGRYSVFKFFLHFIQGMLPSIVSIFFYLDGPIFYYRDMLFSLSNAKFSI